MFVLAYTCFLVGQGPRRQGSCRVSWCSIFERGNLVVNVAARRSGKLFLEFSSGEESESGLVHKDLFPGTPS